MKRIPLARGGYALVDDRDFEALSQLRWRMRRDGYVVATNPEGRLCPQVIMHRVILDAPPGVQVDHVDRNRLNNTRANLRLCSARENSRNVGPRGQSRYKGVTRDRGRWRSQIWSGERKVFLGRFDSKIKAAEAYDRAAAEMFGDFAFLNFPVRNGRPA